MESIEPTPRGSPLAADIASLAVCSLIWGTTWRAIKLQLGSVPPVESVVYRFALAAALLFGWLLLTRQKVSLTRRQHLEVLGQGVFNFSILYACVYLAEQKVSSGAMAVLFAATAFINLVLFRLVLKQRASRLGWAGCLFGLAGVATISASQVTGLPGDGPFWILMAFVGVIAGVVGNLFAARGQAIGVPTASGTAWAMAYGAGLLGLGVLVTGTPWRFEPSVRYVGALLYLSVLGSVAAFLVFYALARRRDFTFASYIAALTPPTAMIISAFTESARWGWAALAGLGLVLGGQLLLIRGGRR